jgi:hypothetical protein
MPHVQRAIEQLEILVCDAVEIDLLDTKNFNGGIKSLRATLSDEIFTGDFAS